MTNLRREWTERSSRPGLMEAFGLRAPIKGTLQGILQDYPGGQLLSEALQNAEDSSARSLTLTLDLREHDVKENMLSGASFVIADDGNGFSDGSWKSIQNLYESNKCDSPSDIGRYGMGSRSFFHYADVLLVYSNGKYVGLDPLGTIKSCGRSADGWLCNMQACTAADVAPLVHEAQQLLLPFQIGDDRGAIFRLPLRRAEHVHDGLGPDISAERAQTLLDDWAATLSQGHLLLFLSTIQEVTLWRWDPGSSEPTLVARVTKEYIEGGPCPRLPQALPPTAYANFDRLSLYLNGLDDDERHQLSKRQSAVVATVSLVGGIKNRVQRWLIVQRFDAVNCQLRQLVQSCRAIPTVGIAVRPTQDSNLYMARPWVYDQSLFAGVVL